MSEINKKNRLQRALVLQGGGTLGAYEAGVLNVLCKNLVNSDKENGHVGKVLFDIVAGTSIGAMNGSILVSQFLKTQSWEKAADKLARFWTEQLSIKCLDTSDLNRPWYYEWIKRTSTTASEEAARRYYSVKKLVANQVRNNMYYQCKVIEDTKYFDKPLNLWYLHSSKPLQESIEKYATFPIATAYSDEKDNNKQQQPRLLVFSVDVAEGVTVTFDSYPKADGSRKSEYGKGLEKIIINYNDGISIDHVMASGTLPEFYDYVPIPIDTTAKQENHGDRCETDTSDIRKRYFWDGGLLSNTPLRELLQAHQEYWEEAQPGDLIPDLDVYIVNTHCPTMDSSILPRDHDGVKDRINDIVYGDRTSHYDERAAHTTADYANFVTQLKDLTDEAFRKVEDGKDKEELVEKLQNILATKTITKDNKGNPRRYEDLMRGGFRINKIVRIERTNYINSTFTKTGDLTFETINKLIKEGECDAWFALIQDDINKIKLADRGCIHTHSSLTETLTSAMDNLRTHGYEDNNSQSYSQLTNFIDDVEKQNKLEPCQSEKLIQSAKAFRDIL